VTDKATILAISGFTIAALLILFAEPIFQRARRTPATNGCINNLRCLDGAKQTWALENHKGSNDIPMWSDIILYLPKNCTNCPQGGKYRLGRVGPNPLCSFPRHRLP
jgi:hypothetical protein